MSRIELNEKELEQVSGGAYYDAICTKCGQRIGGAGFGSFTLEKAKDKYRSYNRQGCPGCNAPGEEGLFQVVCYANLDDLVSHSNFTVYEF